MKESSKNALRKMAELSKPICMDHCPSAAKKVGEEVGPTRCCHPAFCEAAKFFLNQTNQEVPEPTDHPTLPFMGEQGCILEPEQRPTCAGYVCPGYLKTADRKFRKQWARLEAKLKQDPAFVKLSGQMADIVRAFFK